MCKIQSLLCLYYSVQYQTVWNYHSATTDRRALSLVMNFLYHIFYLKPLCTSPSFPWFFSYWNHHFPIVFISQEDFNLLTRRPDCLMWPLKPLESPWQLQMLYKAKWGQSHTTSVISGVKKRAEKRCSNKWFRICQHMNQGLLPCVVPEHLSCATLAELVAMCCLILLHLWFDLEELGSSSLCKGKFVL